MEDREIVILLHGLARTARSMAGMERALQKKGFMTMNVGYPSRKYPVNRLVETAVTRAVAECRKKTTGKIHFVTHSLGGILVRHYLASYSLARLGKVVMLAPPNHGSEIVDRLGGTWWFRIFNGPAGCSLGTGPDSVPATLGPADFPLGILSGDRSLDPLLSRMVPKPNDGKVSLASAALEGMRDFKAVPYGHTFVMNQRKVIRLTVCFLRNGSFSVAHQVEDEKIK